MCYLQAPIKEWWGSICLWWIIKTKNKSQMSCIDFWVFPLFQSRPHSIQGPCFTWVKKMDGWRSVGWLRNIYTCLSIFLPLSKPSPRPVIQDAGNRCIEADLGGRGSPASLYQCVVRPNRSRGRKYLLQYPGAPIWKQIWTLDSEAVFACVCMCVPQRPPSL